LKKILVTGSHGLIGSALVAHLAKSGYEVVRFDSTARQNDRPMDITDKGAVADAMDGCAGVVHLAAVSRVVWAEQDPARCHEVNVVGTQNLLAAASCNPSPPWVLVASSREVYGQADAFPVQESADLRPLNEYGRSKLEVEKLVASYREGGLRASVIRFSNVYGSVADHADRVVPAFARLAAGGGILRVDGLETTLDFTHVDDVTTALQSAIEILVAGGGPLPSLHLVSGRGTTLAELADIAIKAARQGSVEVQPSRSYDVSYFVGDPARADQVLRWRANTALEQGIADLVERYKVTTEPTNPTTGDRRR
jgi:nucleoside-diphosphate-sugar epimerase